jgi:hypothetical protein
VVHTAFAEKTPGGPASAALRALHVEDAASSAREGEVAQSGEVKSSVHTPEVGVGMLPGVHSDTREK